MSQKKNTRTAKGTGNIRQRKDGRWEGRYYVVNPRTGVKERKSVYGDTQAAVVKKIQSISVDIDKGLYADPEQINVEQWLRIFLNEYTGNLKESSKRKYRYQIEGQIIPALGKIRLSKLRPPQIQAFYNKIAKDHEPATVHNIHAVLHKALKQAITIRYLNWDPSEGCKLPKIEKTKLNVLDREKSGVFMNTIKGHRFENLFTVALFTGLRKAEILGLTWDCYDQEAGTLFIYRQYTRKEGGGCTFTAVKNGKPRTIGIAPSVIKALRSERAVQAQNQILAGHAWRNHEGFIFTNKLGDPIAESTLQRDYKDIVSKCGMEKLRFHDLRHSYAVMSLEAGVSIKTLQDALGHHSAAFTLDIYGHVSDEMRKDGAAKLENLINTI